MSGEPDSFPRRYARTQRFTLGEPRAVEITAAGDLLLFLRTADGVSRSGMLWALDVASGAERLLADPAALLGAQGEDLSPQERARRERARESGAGLVAYSVDDAGATAVFALSGRLWACAVDGSGTRELTTPAGVIDPRIDPTGRTVAYLADGALRVVELDGTGDRALAEPEADTIVWGQAEFVAAEEMDRPRGYWWAPDGSGLLMERYDEAPVPVWYLADPADPAVPPAPHRYPVAGSPDADVQLWLCDLDGDRRPVRWDAAAFPYLARVSWTAAGPPVLQVLSRDQTSAAVLAVDVATGDTTVAAEQHDDAWVELVDGVPTLTPDGRLVTVLDDVSGGSTRRLAVDGVPVSPVGLQVRSVQSVDADGVLVVAAGEDPVDTGLLRIGYDGTITDVAAGPGVFTGRSGAGITVVTGSDLDSIRSRTEVRRSGATVAVLTNLADDPGFRPRVQLIRTGSLGLSTAVLLPRGHSPGSARLPVLVAPYGGPHGQLVRRAGRLFLQSQWLADQGFAVVVADGRGTPGRSPAWEKAVRDEFVTVPLADQVDAVRGAADQVPDLDLGRVGILGWSFGGYLAALAVLGRPDVFHAAVAGAPVTDWRLYDTVYTERYLGHPDRQPEVYDRNSLTGLAGGLNRPLLIVHGMVDDNVVVAHTLRLSSALLAAGRPHSVLPLTGVTHMASQETVAENLLLLQVQFLRDALGAEPG